MTWSNKLVRVALAVGMLGALALASGANFTDYFFWLWW
jgi:hypothetical protein